MLSYLGTDVYVQANGLGLYAFSKYTQWYLGGQSFGLGSCARSHDASTTVVV